MFSVQGGACALPMRDTKRSTLCSARSVLQPVPKPTLCHIPLGLPPCQP